ncbi:MAG: hypothetical protein KME14_19580 [Tildeniella torsiva UHER 1998/13D]|jgi:hypothetical protein|nr:hypothetical protein [Tildeniella torsiva UHER 1998/13D]
MSKLINDLQGLYRRENRREKFELLVCRLVQHSETDLDLKDVVEEDLQNISKQWFFTSADIEQKSSCLCSQGEAEGEEIKYVTYIKNRLNGNVARIGSTCIAKFGDDNPIAKEADILVRLMKNNSVRVSVELAELMAKQEVITQLELALIKELGRKRKLEQDSINVLSVLKAKIAIEKIPPTVTDFSNWIADFRRKNPENPEFISPFDNKKVVVSERLIDEYRELRKKLLVADASEHEKQTVVRVLGAFYSQKLMENNIDLEPTRERPNLEQCQLDKFQVNRCNADEMIQAAELKVQNYIGSRNENIIVEKETYTKLSVLLDAYHRFNHVSYNIDLLDGIQESIARLELEIEKLPSLISRSLEKSEKDLKDILSKNIDDLEIETRQKHDTFWQELQQVKGKFANELKKMLAESKKLLSRSKAELIQLTSEKEDLITQHASAIEDLEADIWSAINDKDSRINSIREGTEEHRYVIDRLNDELEELKANSRREIESLKSINKRLTTATADAITGLDKNITDTKQQLEEIKKKSDVEWWLTMALVLCFVSAFYWMLDTRLNRLEINRNQRNNPASQQLP